MFIMWVYYLMLIGAMLLFSIQFVFNKCYQKRLGSTLFYSMIFSAVVAAVSVPYFIAINGGKIEYTPFSLLIAILYAVDVLACGVFGAKTLSRANLSVYSLFMMLGGMLIPFLYGFSLGEKMTLLKGVAMAFVLASMLFTLKKEDDKRADWFTIVCYVAIFVTNGVTGMLTFVHQRAEAPTVSSSGFLILWNVAKMVIAVLVIIGFIAYAKLKDPSVVKVQGASTDGKKGGAFSNFIITALIIVGFAVVHGTASLLSTETALYIDAGVQSTICTGGCILMSAIFGMIFGEKITKKTVLTVVCALIGTVLMML
jgi:drug/metabolite transporter (DMT)-like permease